MTSKEYSMTTNDPRPSDKYVIRERNSNVLGWTLGAIAAALIIGLAFFSLRDAQRTPTAANPPAVTAAPAPARGVTAPAPGTTTGQAPQPLDQGNDSVGTRPPAPR